jgi:FRG domain
MFEIYFRLASRWTGVQVPECFSSRVQDMQRFDKFEEVVQCQEANEFLDKLSPRKGNIFYVESCGSYRDTRLHWLYRGQSDNEHSLVPSAFRKGPACPLAAFGDVGHDRKSQVKVEIQALGRFFSLADATGLPLPEDSQKLRTTFSYFRSRKYLEHGNPDEWPPSELWSLLGLAQHYGLPTRLLDWSRRAIVAAFFAAEGAALKYADAKAKANDSSLDLSLQTKRLVVWAFGFWRFAERVGKRPDDGPLEALFGDPELEKLPIVPIVAPHAHNPNLHAQDGLFTLVRQLPEADPEKGFDPEKDYDAPLDQVAPLYKVTDSSDASLAGYKPIIYRITLPWSEAGDLMDQLSQEGINAATIYPGFNGVVTTLKQEWKYAP